MTRCPFCFHDLGRPEAAFVCTDPQSPCPDVPDEHWAGFRGGAAPERRPVTYTAAAAEEKRWRVPDSVRCGRCTSFCSAQACPRCHQPLPPGWRQVQTTCLAVAGPRTSGKSVYIGVAVKQLAALVQQLGGALGFADAASERTYREEYEKPLFEQRGILPPTAPHGATESTTRVPLVFTLGSVRGERRVLVLRDIAGEDLENASVDRRVFRFLADADGILFMVDPLKRETVRLMLAGIIDAASQVGKEPLEVLDNVTRLLQSPGSTGKIAVPLAVVLSKFDALRELRQVKGSRWDAVMANTGAALNRDPLDSTGFDTADADLLQAEVESMLARLDEHGVLNRLSSDFATTRLFAVSALGAPPRGQNQHAHGIAPFRCLDPLKWFLSRTGALASS